MVNNHYIFFCNEILCELFLFFFFSGQLLQRRLQQRLKFTSEKFVLEEIVLKPSQARRSGQAQATFWYRGRRGGKVRGRRRVPYERIEVPATSSSDRYQVCTKSFLTHWSDSQACQYRSHAIRHLADEKRQKAPTR